ncbi:hypothetical protein [Alkanindiges illinoisensis]|uniref:hypothetical protein n=1 Tax=Alkanindiges illinoisensis TaxID=197183 RepID=UPI0004795A65|nr:hypothetical protein [Alkanindiges illinoisensis]
MANLQGEKQWSPVRVLETNELARGGLNGNMNEQAKALLDRTEWLNEQKANKSEIIQGHFAFNTLADFNAKKATVPANSTVVIAEAGANQGENIWNGSTLTKSAYDPLVQANAYADIKESNAKTYTKNEVAKMANTITSKNLYNPAVKQVNKYILSGTNSGFIRAVNGWGITEFISVVPGQYYTIKCNATKRGGTAFYTDNTGSDSSFIAGSYTGGDLAANTARTVQAPTGAKFMAVSLYSDTIAEPSQVMIEAGEAASAYTPYTEPTLAIKEDVLPNNLVKQDQIPDLVKKPYEKVITFKNLFDLTKVKDGQYLNSTNGGIMVSAGWGTSDAIPVTAGQQYTISGIRGRAGVAFFASATTTTAVAGSYNGATTSPLTVTAPAGATHMRINLYSSSVPTYSNVQVEAGSTATAYDPTSGTKILVDASQIYNAATAANTVTFAGQTVTVKSMVDGLPVEMSALLTIAATHDKSTVFNFIQDKFNKVTQRTMNDDVAPIRAFGTTIGANHGYLKTTITLAAHGKTNADVGSVWNSGGKQWVIVEIISTSQLSITSRTDNTGFVSGKLEHSSGAVNTADMTPTAAADSAFHPVFKNRKLTCSIDGKPVVIADGETEYRNNVTFNESYDIMAKNDMVEWLITHGGAAAMQYDADASISLSMNYCFDIDGGCVITSDLLALKAVTTFTDFMLLQAIKMAAGNGTVEYIVPKSKAFTQDSVSYDFSYPTDIIAKNPANDINFNAAKNADGLTPVNRLLQRNDQVVFATGFLPILDATPASRVTNAPNKYLQIRASSLKVYPALIDGLKTSLAAGDYFCGVGYRKYAKRTTDRTSAIAVRHKLGDFLIVDWHQAKTDSVSLPADYAGRSFEVFEKSANVEVLSKTATNRVVFRTSSAAPAFAVLLFK